VDRGASHYVTAAPTPAQRHTLALSSRRAIFEFGIAIRLCARDNTAFFSGVVAFCVLLWEVLELCDCIALCVLYRFGITRRLTSSFDDGVSARLSGALAPRGMGNSFAECATVISMWRGVGYFQSEI
jgi:hypothetical protein